MKTVFIGFIYFGWWYGWQALPPVFFDDHDKCKVYMNELASELKFHKSVNQHDIESWSLKCSTVFKDGDGNLLPEFQY